MQAAAALCLEVLAGPVLSRTVGTEGGADLILRNGRVTTLDPKLPEASAIALKDGMVLAVGSDAKITRLADSRTRVIDAGKRRVIPGLIDSHTHFIRGGLSYNLELRWDGVRSLAIAMAMLREQVQRTPAPQWVRVLWEGGRSFSLRMFWGALGCSCFI